MHGVLGLLANVYQQGNYKIHFLGGHQYHPTLLPTVPVFKSFPCAVALHYQSSVLRVDCLTHQ